jgi:hypothetical protein
MILTKLSVAVLKIDIFIAAYVITFQIIYYSNTVMGRLVKVADFKFPALYLTVMGLSGTLNNFRIGNYQGSLQKVCGSI